MADNTAAKCPKKNSGIFPKLRVGHFTPALASHMHTSQRPSRKDTVNCAADGLTQQAGTCPCGYRHPAATGPRRSLPRRPPPHPFSLSMSRLRTARRITPLGFAPKHASEPRHTRCTVRSPPPANRAWESRRAQHRSGCVGISRSRQRDTAMSRREPENVKRETPTDASGTWEVFPLEESQSNSAECWFPSQVKKVDERTPPQVHCIHIGNSRDFNIYCREPWPPT
ncbi:uncharacterized protein LOC142817806 isoform X1 [Rhipicephalus microplus]|uniref:uncharacterized protein LOC142817806 isoform X1 n=1 Tax=Rhipicephalus microplus TaxID=6941 RepID=UPI003F6CCD5F